MKWWVAARYLAPPQLAVLDLNNGGKVYKRAIE